MRPIRALLVVSLSGLVAGACAGSPSASLRSCQSDAECGPGLLCFAEGCGDPGRDLGVEIEGGSLSGHLPQDFALTNGIAASTQDFDLGAPLSVAGEFQRERSIIPNPTDRTYYSDAVTLRAVGWSSIFPGISRTFESRMDKPERGAFELKMGAGRYTITATPSDRSVPPVTAAVLVDSTTTQEALSFVFPSPDGAPALTGQLVKVSYQTLPQLLDSAAAATVDLQLFSQMGEPLSQRFPISSSTGEFALTVHPRARAQTNLVLMASSRDPGALVPTKRFVLSSFPTAPISLEYGDFGREIAVQGLVVDARSRPISGAQISLEGVVGGGGVFRSKLAETGPGGEFTLTALAAAGVATSYQMTVVSPAGQRAASATRTISVAISGDRGILSPSVLMLEDRAVTTGVVMLPGGQAPAAGVAVRATLQITPIDSTEPRASLKAQDVTTGAEGTYELLLDPGIWKVEYRPSTALPLASRRIFVLPTSGSPQTLTPVELSPGRTVSGTVTGSAGPIPYSRLRFFRVGEFDGQPASILLGSAIADERGKYQIVLPVAQSSSP